MTQELISAVREALSPFKEELKTELKAEIQAELLGPMEARLQGQIVGLGERLDRLEVEVRSLTNDVIGPFIEEVSKQHRGLVERLERLEVQVERNRDRIDRILTSVTMQERRLMDVYDDVTAIRQRLNSLERRLSGEAIYDVAEAEFAVAEERSVYEMLRDLEERVTRLEGRTE